MPVVWSFSFTAGVTSFSDALMQGGLGLSAGLRKHPRVSIHCVSVFLTYSGAPKP